MKKLGILILAITALHLGTWAQKTVFNENAQKREIGSFHSIETSSGIEVFITQGNKEELAVSVGDMDYLNEVRTEVVNGKLKISRTNDWKFWNKWKNWKVKVYVSFKQLDEIKASSGGTIQGTELSFDKLSATFNSGAIISLSGKVAELDVSGNSGAQFKGYDLLATHCKADVNSGAGIQVTVNKEISAKASSGGFIRFKGEGLIRDINVNSGGTVKRQS